MCVGGVCVCTCGVQCALMCSFLRVVLCVCLFACVIRYLVVCFVWFCVWVMSGCFENTFLNYAWLVQSDSVFKALVVCALCVWRASLQSSGWCDIFSCVQFLPLVLCAVTNCH